MKWQGPPLVAALLLATGASGEEPQSLAGVHQVSDLGLVEFFQQSNGHVTGKYRTGGLCSSVFEPDKTTVIEGDIDGTLFVGMVTLCQSGSCKGVKHYPFLGVFSGSDMVGYVKLTEGCTSPGISGNKLEVTVADAEQKKALGADSVSASDIANRGDAKGANEKLEEEINRYFTAAQTALSEGRYADARSDFLKVIAANNKHSPAYLGLGIAQLHLKEPPERALESMQRALDHGKGMGAGYLAQVHYNRACALTKLDRKKEALAALRIALADGQLADDAEKDPELNGLRAERGFLLLLKDARAKRPRNNR